MSSQPRSQHLLWVGLITAFAFLTYVEIFTYNTFGPEFPLYYFWHPPMSFPGIMRAYTYNYLMWYRPTATDSPFWFGQLLLNWHDLFGWKLYHFTTVLATTCAVYWLVLILLPGRRLAASLAAVYFVAHPSMYTMAMELSAFDFLHILFTVLCTGFFILSLRTRGWKSAMHTAVAWIFFVAGLTSKEVTVALPGYLAVVSLLFLWLEKRVSPPRSRWAVELLRLAPFFAMLPVYYEFHITHIPAGTFTSSGIYRTGVNWDVILANVRRFPLWIARIYYLTEEPVGQRMYQSSLLNNLVGIAAFGTVALAWVRAAIIDRSYRFPLLVALGWIAVFLAIPVYSGGFVWHINLPVAGYAILFGVAIAQCARRIPAARWRAAAVAVFLAGWLLLARANLHVELDRGTHATGFHINHSLLQAPPVAAAALGKEPLIFIEDRLGIGAWWYGCYGNLFNYVYLRRDIKEQIFPSIRAVPPAARAKWLSHPNSYYFRYDQHYDWHDESALFRSALTRVPARSVAPFPIRIIAGGSRTVDASGQDWDDDRNYSAGSSYQTERDIIGTDTSDLYRSERFNTGPFEYRFAVPAGEYAVRLKFAEIYFSHAGQRSFDVILNGSKVLSNFDIAAAAGGPYRAIDKQFRTKADHGEILIQFVPGVDNPEINAIEITR